MKSFIISLLLVATSLVVVAQAPTTSFNIYFDYNSSVLDADRAIVIGKHLFGYQVDSVVAYASVEGNADYNRKLAMARGIAVANTIDQVPIRIETRGATSLFGSDKAMNRVVIIYATWKGSSNDVYTDNHQNSHTSGFVKAVSYGSIPDDVAMTTINTNKEALKQIETITIKVVMDSMLCNPCVNTSPTVAKLKPSKVLSFEDAYAHYRAKGLSKEAAIEAIETTVQDGIAGRTDLYIYRGRFNKTKASAAARNWSRIKQTL
jgi:hypothetical protein